jgi:putative oxidoreductase
VKYVVLAARLFIGGLFVYASIYKILSPADFATAIRNYLILPPAWSNLAALMLPWVELVAGSFLMLGIESRPAALLVTGMLGVFLAAMVYAYSIGLDIDCGCFGSPQSSAGRVGGYHIVRDSLLFLVSLGIVVFDRGDFGVKGMLRIRSILGSKPA